MLGILLSAAAAGLSQGTNFCRLDKSYQGKITMGPTPVETNCMSIWYLIYVRKIYNLTSHFKDMPVPSHIITTSHQPSSAS
jgi:hypothetical protein